jgi:hypothetical protein
LEASSLIKFGRHRTLNAVVFPDTTNSCCTVQFLNQLRDEASWAAGLKKGRKSK